MVLLKLVKIGPLEPHRVPHHHQVDVLALQAPGGLGPGIAGGGRHHQVTKPLGHGPVYQFQTGRVFCGPTPRKYHTSRLIISSPHGFFSRMNIWVIIANRG